MTTTTNQEKVNPLWERFASTPNRPTPGKGSGSDFPSAPTAAITTSSTPPTTGNFGLYSSTLLPPETKGNGMEENEEEDDDGDYEDEYDEEDEYYDDDGYDNDTHTSNTCSKTDQTISTLGTGTEVLLPPPLPSASVSNRSHSSLSRHQHFNGTIMATNGSANSCNVTESLCGFYDIAKSRQEPMAMLQQQQQQRNRMTSSISGENDTTHSKNKNSSISDEENNGLHNGRNGGQNSNHKRKVNSTLRELQRRNYQLYHRNRLLEAEQQQQRNETSRAEMEALQTELRQLKEQQQEQQQQAKHDEVAGLPDVPSNDVSSSKADHDTLLKERDATISALCEQVSLLQQQQQTIPISPIEPKTDPSITTSITTAVSGHPFLLDPNVTTKEGNVISQPESERDENREQMFQKYQEQIVELEQSNAQLEIDHRDALDHMEYTKQYYSDVLHEIETKYGTMEHQLLQTKLQLAAVQEQNEQTNEEHATAMSSIKQEKDDICEKISKMQQEKDELVSELMRAVAEQYATKELVIANDMEHCSKVDRLERDIKSLQNERTQLIQMVERLKEHEHEEKKSIDVTTSENDCLRRQLQESQHAIDNLQQQLSFLMETEHSNRISPLEQQQNNVNDLTNKVKQLKKRLYVAKNENSRYRAQLILKSKSLDENPAATLFSFNNNMKLNSSDDITEDTADMLLEDDTESDASEFSTRRLLMERDDAISSLVKQALQQDQMISSLRTEIESLKTGHHHDTETLQSSNDAAKSTTTLHDDNTEALVEQLQKEAEVFASQVIELDDEIEQLRSRISQHERHISDLEHQLQEAKQQQQSLLANVNNRSVDVNENEFIAKSSKKEFTLKILDLESEIDELKEANMTQRTELRDLRRKVLYSESTTDEIVHVRNETVELKAMVETQQTAIEFLNQEKATLTEELNGERAAKIELENKLREELKNAQKSHIERIALLESKLEESRWSFDELKASPGHMNEEAVMALRDEIDMLRKNVSSQSEDLRTAKLNVQELEEILADQSNRDADNFEEEKEELFAEIESLTQRLHDADEKIRVLEEDSGIIAEFKDKLERADEAREASEKNIIDTFERRISLLTLDKDVTIDKLRKEIMIEKESAAEEMEGLAAQVKAYQLEISELQEEMQEQIEYREARIYTLEATMSAQEQLIGNMKSEMDHLQGSMENSVARRKEENDELQQELLSISATAAKQEREITTLKLEMEAKSLGYISTISKLEQKLSVLEKAPTELRNAQDLQMELRVKEVKDRLEKLKWRNASLKDENMNLRERLEQADMTAQANSDGGRMKELEEQLATQLLKVQSLESELKRAPTDPVATMKTTSAMELSSPTIIIVETEMTVDSANVDAESASTDPAVTLSKETSTASTGSPPRPPSHQPTDRKVSAPSPSRRGLKLFGRNKN